MIVSEWTFAIVITGCVVHWIAASGPIMLVVFHPDVEIFEPFLSLGVGSGDDPAFAADAIGEDLHGIDDYSSWFVLFWKDV